MEILDIKISSLGIAFLLLIVPVALSFSFGFNLVKLLLLSTLRMLIQLILIGIFLKYLFSYNCSTINFIWLLIMITVAVFTAAKGSSIKITKVFIPIFLSFFIATFSVIFYMNYFVVSLENVFDARYLIVLGGMLLGNSLRGNIIGISTFYKNIKKDQKKYLYSLALGNSRFEALHPYLKESVRLALKPSLAAMATMGVVSLPGMMTGVIISGASPIVAIKYQIMIMIGILVSTIISVLLTILMTRYVCFDKNGVLKQNIFRIL